MNHSDHAWRQMQRRGIDQDDVDRTVDARYFVGLGDFGRRVYVRRYGDVGMRFVVLAARMGIPR